MSKQIPEQLHNGIVAIASSTGGPGALLKVLPELPADFPYPVLVVQHMWVGFTSHFAKALGEKCPMPVVEAEDGLRIRPGTIYIAPAGQHLRVKHIPGGHITHLSSEPPREGVRPSANILFESIAESGYTDVVAVVLTGMGADGTAGIKALKEKKKVTVIAQNEETSVINGMPGSIRRNFPECIVLPIEQIGGEIRKNMEG